MRIFVSGQIEEKERIREVFSLLRGHGHEITHDWTRTDDLANKRVHKSESGDRAKRDIDGVVNCEAYVLMSDNNRVGKGMYVELGAALALRARGDGPLVYIVGPMNHLSIFYLHPDVIEVATVQDLVKELESRRNSGTEHGRQLALA
jgi:hypothetical protein